MGAYALAANGVVRATSDLDVLVRLSPKNAARVFDALRAFGAPLATHAVTAADFAVPGNVYQMGLPPRRIDILTSISGVTFAAAVAHKVVGRLAELEVPCLGRAALIRNKRAAARPKDLADVAALEALVVAGPPPRRSPRPAKKAPRPRPRREDR